MLRVLKKALARLNRSGVLGTGAAIYEFVRALWRDWVDAAIDRRYGLNTCGVFDTRDMECMGPHARYSAGHQPIQERVFKRCIKRLPLALDSFTFIDVGSGKGRAIILAAHHQFRRLIGVELSSELHKVAKENVRRFRLRRPAGPEIELRCEDAAIYVFPLDAIVCFLYNPFGEVVLRKVLENLKSSLIRAPRSAWIIYRNPVHADILDRCDFLELRVAEDSFRVYEARLIVGPSALRTSAPAMSV